VNQPQRVTHISDFAHAAAKPTGAIDFGIPRTEFLENYFEQRWLLRRGALKSSPVTWNDVDELLYRIDPSSPLFQLFQEGEVPHDQYVDQVVEHGGTRHRLNKLSFYDCMSRGATLVMNRLEEHSLAAKRLCTEVSRFAGFPAIGNAYLSFGGTGTFGKHWDTHDVFVIQLLGKKRWQVFEPTLPLPLSRQTCGAYQSQCPKYPVLDIELSAGDVLYLPRGWWHQAIPQDSGSFHLSVGTYPPTTLEYLQWVSEQRLSMTADARASAGRTGAAGMNNVFADLGEGLKDPNTLGSYRNSLLERERVRSEFNLGIFLDSHRAELSENLRVALNSCYLHAGNVEAILAANTMMINGSALQIDALRKSIVKALAGATATDLQHVYLSLSTIPRAVICMALLDLARHDVVNLWREL
jgi:ribosomal protein L16 Arg81 hydroxylase